MIWGIAKEEPPSRNSRPWYSVKGFREKAAALKWKNQPKAKHERRWIYEVKGHKITTMMIEEECRRRRCHRKEAKASLIYRHGKEIR